MLYRWVNIKLLTFFSVLTICSICRSQDIKFLPTDTTRYGYKYAENDFGFSFIIRPTQSKFPIISYHPFVSDLFMEAVEWITINRDTAQFINLKSPNSRTISITPLKKGSGSVGHYYNAFKNEFQDIGFFNLPYYKGSMTFNFDSAYIEKISGWRTNSASKLFFLSSYLKQVSFVRCDTVRVETMDSHIEQLEVTNTRVVSFHLEGTIDILSIQNSLVSDFFLMLKKKPKRIDLFRIAFRPTSGLLDFTNAWPISDTTKCILSLRGVDASRLKFNYSDFILDTSYMTYQEIESFYNSIKEQYKNWGMTESYQSIDIDLIKLTNAHKGGFYNVIDWVNRNWWKYGYDKSMVVLNSIYLFLFFLLVNLSFGLRRLSTIGYSLIGYHDISNKIGERKTILGRGWYRFWYTFLYTCLVFWGINLDKKELKYGNLCFLFYILFQYLIGIVCLAYLAAFILSK